MRVKFFWHIKKTLLYRKASVNINVMFGRKEFLLFALTFFLFVAVFFNPYARVVGAMDVSLPHRIFLEVRVFDGVKKGDYVEVYVGDVNLPVKRKIKPEYLIKVVGCMEGDRLEYVKGVYYCNGKEIARINPGAPFRPFEFSGVIPKGKLFVIGKHPYSYDSRYMGFVDEKRVVAKMIPLF